MIKSLCIHPTNFWLLIPPRPGHWEIRSSPSKSNLFRVSPSWISIRRRYGTIKFTERSSARIRFNLKTQIKDRERERTNSHFEGVSGGFYLPFSIGTETGVRVHVYERETLAWRTRNARRNGVTAWLDRRETRTKTTRREIRSVHSSLQLNFWRAVT